MKNPIAIDRPLAFIDLETTGLRVDEDRIVELGVLRIEPSGEVIERCRRFCPGISIDPEATAVHKITDADVADEEPFKSHAKSLLSLLDGCDIAGFNIRRFDLPLLIAEFNRAGIKFSIDGRRIIDAQQIFHREEPRSLEAASVKFLGTEHEGAHGAAADVRITAEVLFAQIEHYTHLPRDIDGLHSYCDEVGPVQNSWGYWFKADDGEPVFRRGKHRGVKLATVARQEPGYLHWMLGKLNLDESTQGRLQDAIASSD